MTKKLRLVDCILGFLLLQFLLGMLSNLYATIPKDKPYEVFHHPGLVFFHAYNAVLLLALGIIFLVKTVRRKGRIWLAGLGLAGIVTAYAGGISFVFTQQDFLSLIMSLGFIAAFMAYAFEAFSSRSRSGH